MRKVNIHEAKTHLSKLIDYVIHGETIIIALAGKPVAKLEAIKSPQRRFGVLKSRMRIAKDFDAPISGDLLSQFEGEGGK